jgi:hypothetical protein
MIANCAAGSALLTLTASFVLRWLHQEVIDSYWKINLAAGSEMPA